MKPLFCGNLDYDARQSELDRLFSKYGRVDRIDMKSGYAFVYFEDECDAGDAMRGLDGIPFGYTRCRLSVEWSMQVDHGPRNHDGSRSMANMRPTKTLFVINLDPIRTRVWDIERHFEPYGKITNVRIRGNFAFVQFETQEETTRALDRTNMRKILDRVVSVEYAFRDDDDQGGMRGSPRRGGYGRCDDNPYGRLTARATIGATLVLTMAMQGVPFMINTMILLMIESEVLIKVIIQVGYLLEREAFAG